MLTTQTIAGAKKGKPRPKLTPTEGTEVAEEGQEG